MTFSTLISVVLLATSAIASPTANKKGGSFIAIPSSISLHAAIQIGSNGGARDIIANDRKRFQKLRTHGQANFRNLSFAEDTNVPVSNAGAIFTAEVGVGTPPTTYNLIVDTGSSNTFVGANIPYTSTSSSKDTSKSVQVSYGSGGFSGTEFTDTVTLGNASIYQQSIGVASQSEGFQGFDGILGLGPVGLTSGTVEGEDTIPTVTDNIAKQGNAAAALVGIAFAPSGATNSSGSLDFGEPDQSKFIGDVKFTPITQANPSNAFWGIDQSITYGDDNTLILNSNAGIVDTGTTLLYIASDAFEAYVKATGATQDESTGLLKVDNPDNLKSMFFHIGDNTFEFTADAQMWPRSLNLLLGADSNSTFLIVSDIGSPSGEGMDFINGFTFLQRFYSVYDTANSQVGFATTPYTNAIVN